MRRDLRPVRSTTTLASGHGNPASRVTDLCRALVTNKELAKLYIRYLPTSVSVRFECNSFSVQPCLQILRSSYDVRNAEAYFFVFSHLLIDSSSRNSSASIFSAPPESYWGHFDQVSKYNVQLNVFERLWASWYAYMQHDVLATGIMSFVMHEAVYFGRSLPWMIIDRISHFNKYKIQNVGFPGALLKIHQMLTSW